MVWPINRVRVGSLAPDFELPTAGTGDVKLRLSQLFHQGWVVLLFFPFSFSPACTQELATFQALLPRFTSLGATVVAVSVDSPFVLRAFAERLGITFPLLSDFNRTAARRYGVLISRWGLHGFANRAAFLIAPGGRVADSWRAPDLGILPEPARLLERLVRLGAPGAPREPLNSGA